MTHGRATTRRVALLATVAAVALTERGGAQPPANPTSPRALSAAEALAPMSWRNIGPNVGGRSITVAGSTKRPLEYYFGAVGGGLWKTTNAGTDWRPVTDGQLKAASSVGAVGVCDANPDVVYIGTGEAQFRNSINLGDEYEVREWTMSLGCTEVELRAVVQAIGNDAEKVRAYLRDK